MLHLYRIHRTSLNPFPNHSPFLSFSSPNSYWCLFHAFSIIWSSPFYSFSIPWASLSCASTFSILSIIFYLFPICFVAFDNSFDSCVDLCIPSFSTVFFSEEVKCASDNGCHPCVPSLPPPPRPFILSPFNIHFLQFSYSFPCSSQFYSKCFFSKLAKLPWPSIKPEFSVFFFIPMVAKGTIKG